jgi:hypothetical protein
MLKEHSSSASVAVSDNGRARTCYREVLGLKLVDEGIEGVRVFRTGAAQLTVYQSAFDGTNRAEVYPEPLEGRWCGTCGELDAIVPTSKPRAPASNIIPTSAASKATSTAPAA